MQAEDTRRTMSGLQIKFWIVHMYIVKLFDLIFQELLHAGVLWRVHSSGGGSDPDQGGSVPTSHEPVPVMCGPVLQSGLLRVSPGRPGGGRSVLAT